jgi:hypothetical protein
VAFGRGRSPCAASAFGRFADFLRQAFCFLFAKSLSARAPRFQISLSRLPVAYRSIEYGQISDLPCVNWFGVFRPKWSVYVRYRAHRYGRENACCQGHHS